MADEAGLQAGHQIWVRANGLEFEVLEAGDTG